MELIVEYLLILGNKSYQWLIWLTSLCLLDAKLRDATKHLYLKTILRDTWSLYMKSCQKSIW